MSPVNTLGKDWTGIRVFFWSSDAQIRYGTVVDAMRLEDGTQVLAIKTDHGETVSLPAAGVSLVTSTPPTQP
ncbi:hypothetical protein Hypma_015047 [Hypsizygus marmoreus]|uniref:SLA1 homology domain-containing protein n=1 Tax=Hypsizygus marmoreus TaxID=39966 RepID=A0A369K9T3_HYPMA|nr:hypothetical protein Hypma_015047 [Hypsizygus marmoreus]